MDTRLLRHAFLPVLWTSVDDIGHQSTAVPQAVYIGPGYNLYKAAGGDMPYLDESGVEQENIGRVDGNLLCGTFPFDSAQRSAGLAMLVHVKAEFYAQDI